MNKSKKILSIILSVILVITNIPISSLGDSFLSPPDAKGVIGELIRAELQGKNINSGKKKNIFEKPKDSADSYQASEILKDRQIGQITIKNIILVILASTYVLSFYLYITRGLLNSNKYSELKSYNEEFLEEIMQRPEKPIKYDIPPFIKKGTFKNIRKRLLKFDLLGAVVSFWSGWNPSSHLIQHKIFLRSGGNYHPIVATLVSFSFSIVLLHIIILPIPFFILDTLFNTNFYFLQLNIFVIKILSVSAILIASRHWLTVMKIQRKRNRRLLSRITKQTIHTEAQSFRVLSPRKLVRDIEVSQ